MNNLKLSTLTLLLTMKSKITLKMKQNNSKISFRLYTMLVILWCIGIHITTYAQTMLEEEACEPLVLPEDVVCESNSIFPQFICKLDGREKIFEPLLLSSSGLRNWTEQIADIAYHPQSNSLFIPLNHSISHPYTYWTDVKSNDFIRGYDIENETLFKATIVGFDFYDVSADFEGLTHLKDNYFVLLDEGLNRIYFLEYLAEDRQFNVLSGHDTWIPRNTDLDPDYIDFFHNGLKGVSYDPNTNRLYMISEVPVEISGQKGRTLFSAALTLPSEESTGDIHEISSARLDHIIGSDASGIFHLGNIYPSNSAKSNNILGKQ